MNPRRATGWLMNEHALVSPIRTRRRLVGSAAAIAGLWLPAQAAAQVVPDAAPSAVSSGTGARLLTQFIDEVLNGRSVANLEAIVHAQIEYPTGRTVGLDGFRDIWTADADHRNALSMVDEYQPQVVLGDEQWGMAYLIYTARTLDGESVGIWLVAYIARIADGLIRTLDAVIDEQEQDEQSG